MSAGAAVPARTGRSIACRRSRTRSAAKVAVLFGSGVRTGPDVYRALALGAEAVLIGRPYVHGLALAGEDGVRHMLRTLLAELEINLAIAGVENHRKLGPSALVRT